MAIYFLKYLYLLAGNVVECVECIPWVKECQFVSGLEFAINTIYRTMLLIGSATKGGISFILLAFDF